MIKRLIQSTNTWSIVLSAVIGVCLVILSYRLEHGDWWSNLFLNFGTGVVIIGFTVAFVDIVRAHRLHHESRAAYTAGRMMLIASATPILEALATVALTDTVSRFRIKQLFTRDVRIFSDIDADDPLKPFRQQLEFCKSIRNTNLETILDEVDVKMLSAMKKRIDRSLDGIKEAEVTFGSVFEIMQTRHQLTKFKAITEGMGRAWSHKVDNLRNHEKGGIYPISILSDMSYLYLDTLYEIVDDVERDIKIIASSNANSYKFARAYSKAKELLIGQADS